MNEIDELRATVAALADRVRLLEDHIEITNLAAQYGPNVDSGSAEAAASPVDRRRHLRRRRGDHHARP